MTEPGINVNFPIAMLGATGVGKTSMLAAMWEQFDRVFPDSSLQFNPRNEDTRRLLTGRLADLKSIAAGEPGEVDLRRGIQGSRDRQDYEFEFFHTGSGSSFQVTFTDYPGGWLDESGDTEQLERIVEEARVILVAADAPAMMELPDHKHEHWNRPKDIAAVLTNTLRKKLVRDRLVLFVPMRGERWLKNGNSSRLYRAFEARFGSARRAIYGHYKTVAAAFCPIQTLGAVEFSRYGDGDTLKPTPVFTKVADHDYSPVDCDQPLRYAMAYMIEVLHRYSIDAENAAKSVLEQRAFYERWKDSFLSVFGVASAKQKQFEAWKEKSDALLKSLAEFAKTCKRTEGFRVIQNRAMLGFKD